MTSFASKPWMACLGIWSIDAEHADERGYGEPFSSASVEFKDGKAHIRTCFVAGTKIKTQSGYKAIETIQTGEIVASANEHTGKISYKKVVQTFIRQAPRIYKLTYKDGTTVETTGDHPFYIQGKGWITVDKLSYGDISPTWTGLKNSNGVVEKEIAFSESKDTISDRVSRLVMKESLAVVDIEVIEEETTVYNFEVEDDHTYFVTDAEVWVHNAGGYGKYDVQKTKVGKEGVKAANQAYLDFKEGRINQEKYDEVMKYIQTGKYDPKFEFIDHETGTRYNKTDDRMYETEYGAVIPIAPNIVGGRAFLAPSTLNAGRDSHQGIDVKTGHCQNAHCVIKSPADGVVSKIVHGKINQPGTGGYGNHIEIKHPSGIISKHAHFSTVNQLLKPGDKIRRGDFIGITGDSGNAYGAHYHYDLIKYDNKRRLELDPMKTKVD